MENLARYGGQPPEIQGQAVEFPHKFANGMIIQHLSMLNMRIDFGVLNLNGNVLYMVLFF